MPGPGFFSSPERPTGAYNAARYIQPGAIETGTTQLHPPRPGFVGTTGSPVSSAQTPPSATTANKAGICFDQVLRSVKIKWKNGRSRTETRISAISRMDEH